MKLIQSDSDSRPQWKQELSNAIESVHQLLHILELDPAKLNLSEAAIQQFPLRVPHSFVNRMKKSDSNDPLLKQILPIQAEEVIDPAFTIDPLQEQSANPVPGLIHKYHNRALIIGAQACAINCRYCFRRHFPYQENRLTKTQLTEIIDYISQHQELDEIILSGGDPLVNNDQQLRKIMLELAEIPHIKRLRIHTRLPVVIPSRINQTLIDWLNDCPVPVTFVLHINHPNEINQEVSESVAKLRNAGCIVLNQAVLMKHINDSVDTLLALSLALFDAGILPYYLNVLDRVAGSQHFEVDEHTALSLIDELMKRTSGYLVPKLVREQPDRPYKVPLQSL